MKAKVTVIEIVKSEELDEENDDVKERIFYKLHFEYESGEIGSLIVDKLESSWVQSLVNNTEIVINITLN